MQKITNKRFFDLIMGGASAKIGAPRYSGNLEVDDAVVAKLANDVKDLRITMPLALLSVNKQQHSYIS